MVEASQGEQTPNPEKEKAFLDLIDRTAVYVERAKDTVWSAIIYDTEHGKLPYMKIEQIDELTDRMKRMMAAFRILKGDARSAATRAPRTAFSMHSRAMPSAHFGFRIARNIRD